jgi:hypothetical protein
LSIRVADGKSGEGLIGFRHIGSKITRIFDQLIPDMKTVLGVALRIDGDV